MALIKRKTRKAIAKQARKLVKKHGSEVAVALITGIVTSIAEGDDQTTKKMRKKLKKAKKSGNFVSEAAAGLMSNLVSNVISSNGAKTKKHAKHDHQDSKSEE